MAFKQLCCFCLVFVLLASSGAKCENGDSTSWHTSKPLVKRPSGSRYKTVLSADGGGTRGIISAMVIIEVERSIKQYLLDHPYYLPAGISSIDDFDINLADYFDCMAGNSAGAWSTMYLASRGGKGASRAVLDRPDIIGQYGLIPNGGAEGLRVFYKEFAAVIYPQEATGTTAGEVLDVTNPSAPSVATPVYPVDGLVTALEAFYGDATLDDLDTSLIVPAFDLINHVTVYFVQNAFGDIPVSSSARLVPRSGPKPATNAGRFVPDLVFDESKNYFLKDVGAASGSPPGLSAAQPVTPVGGDAVEFLCIDGVIPVENTALRAAFFVTSENDLSGLENVAILSLGTGRGDFTNLTRFENAGLAGWLDNFSIIILSSLSDLQATSSLLDFFYYANPNTKPNQFLRINFAAPFDTEEGMILRSLDLVAFVDVYESIGIALAEEHRPSIDVFVRDFIFGE